MIVNCASLPRSLTPRVHDHAHDFTPHLTRMISIAKKLYAFNLHGTCSEGAAVNLVVVSLSIFVVQYGERVRDSTLTLFATRHMSNCGRPFEPIVRVRRR